MKTPKTFFRNLFALSFFISLFISCGSDDNDSNDDDTIIVVDVNASFFTTDDGSVIITTVPCTLSDGSSANCYQIVSSSVPTDHSVGPWCPNNIMDGDLLGGIWIDNGLIYDLDGAFIENLDEFYNDNNWLMYDENGDVFRTDTEEDCINSSTPGVGDLYTNYCIECLPSYVEGLTKTWLIPITPVLQSNGVLFQSGSSSNIPSTRGLALNGIEFSAPAPVNNILGSYTLAPLDDAGGHINISQGYHYHASTGFSTKITQVDGHAALIGYALDGHGIFQLEDQDGNMPTDLDQYRGHYDDTRGYHYHIDEAGNNNFINGLKGAYVN